MPVIIELSGDERKILESYRKAREADQKLRESTGATAAMGSKAANEYANAWLKAGKDSAQGFEGQLSKLRSMGPIGRQVAGDLKTHLVKAGQMSEDSIEDVIKKIRQIDPAAADAAQGMHRKAKAAADKSSSAFQKFGESAKGQVLGIAGAYVGVQQALQVVLDLNQKVVETNREALKTVQQQEDGDRKLLQVASDDPRDFESLRTRADDLARKYGISRNEARNLVASARREGFENSMESIAASQQVIDVGVQTELASKIPAIFRSEGITAEQAINATLTAANRSSVSTEELARAIPVASEGASMAGASASETLAVTAGISDQFNTPQMSADRVKALAMKISLDTGDQGKTAEEMAKLEKAESNRLERAQKSFRMFQERVGDIRGDLELARQQPQTDSSARRITDLETKLQRAERAVQEFDQTSLVKKEIKNDPTRASMKGQGILEPVRQMMKMTDEQRKSILGDDSESNTAFNLIAKNIEKIDAMQAQIEQQKRLTGTAQSSMSIKRGFATADPKLQAVQNVAMSEISLEIEREKRRAVSEGQRQVRKNRALEGAETSGVDVGRIALAEKAVEWGEYVGITNPEAAISSIVGDPLANLRRDLGQAAGGGDKLAQKALLATSRLMTMRQTDPSAILSADDVATFMSDGQRMVSPSQVTLQQQKRLTGAIVQEAKQSRGADQSFANSAIGLLGLGLVDIPVPASRALGRESAVDIVKAWNEGVQVQKEMMEKQNQLLERMVSAAESTSTNTGRAARPTAANAERARIAQQARQPK